MRENNSAQNPKSTSDVQGKDTNKTANRLTLETAIQHQKQELELNFTELVKDAKVDPFETVAKPPSVLEVNGIPFGTRGNFSVLNGKAKSRKTTLALLLTIAKLDNNSFIYKPIVNKAPYTNVIYFDTEQSDYHVHFLGNRVVSKLGLNPNTSRFSLYGLRKHAPEIRLKIIEEVLYNTEDVSFVVLDGVADLVSRGFNDEGDAINIVSKLLKWTQELNIHIVTIIHQNKGDNNAKGQLGSYLMNKAETVLNVTKSTYDDSISIATPAYSRGEEIQDIYFSIDESVMPILTNAPSVAASAIKRKKPTDFDLEFKLNLIEKVFNNEEKLLLQLLKDKLKFHLADMGYSIGYSSLRDWTTYYKEKELILQHSEKMPYTLNSKLIQEERVKFKLD